MFDNFSIYIIRIQLALRSRQLPHKNVLFGFCSYPSCPCATIPFQITHPSICPSSIIWKELEKVPAGQSIHGCVKLKLKMGFDMASSDTETSISSFNKDAQTPLLSSKLLETEDTFDFIIRAGQDLKTEFKAHKCVLAGIFHFVFFTVVI